MRDKFNIQLFADDTKTVEGSKIVYLLRVKEDQASEDAGIIAYTTSNSRSVSNGVGTTQTKDGAVVTPGTVEETLSVTAFFAPTDERITKMENALKNNKVIEIWEADLALPKGSTKYAGTYREGRISSWSLDSPSDGLAELSMEFSLEGGGKTGDVTVSDSQKAEAYAFKDTTKTGA